MKLRPFLLAFAGLFAAAPAYADAVLSLDHGTVWQTSKDGLDSQGFIQIHNTGDAPDTLNAANCSIAATTQLVDGSGAPLPSLAIPPGQTVTLSSTGPHLVLTGVRYKIDRSGILPCAFSFSVSSDLVGYLNAVKRPHS
jgi:periplasmic copper chaperone A